MSDPVTSTLPVTQQLDPWEEPTLEQDNGEETPEVPEAVLETFFDQSTVVTSQAEEYWTEHVLKRPFEADEEEFRFNEHTHTERRTLIDELAEEQAKLELQMGSLDGEEQKKLRQRIVALRERRTQVIMEQAAADITYLLSHRAKIEAEVKELAVNAESQADIEKLKQMGEKALHLSSRMDKFQLYSEAAINLFKKYRETARDLSENIGDERPNRDQEFMYQMLIAVEKSTGNDYEISGIGDRDYITTFTDIRDTITTVNHKDLAILIATRVSQLEETVDQNTQSTGKPDAQKTDEQKPGDPQQSIGGVADVAAGVTFTDFQRDYQPVITEQARLLEDTDQNDIVDSRQGTDGITVTELPEHRTETTTETSADNVSTATSIPTAEELHQEQLDRDQARTKAVQVAIEDVFAPKK